MGGLPPAVLFPYLSGSGLDALRPKGYSFDSRSLLINYLSDF